VIETRSMLWGHGKGLRATWQAPAALHPSCSAAHHPPMVRIAPVTVSPPPSVPHPMASWATKLMFSIATIGVVLRVMIGPDLSPPELIDVPLTAFASLSSTASQDCNRAGGLCWISYEFVIAKDQPAGFYAYGCRVTALDRLGNVVLRSGFHRWQAPLSGGGTITYSRNLAEGRDGNGLDLRRKSTPALRYSITGLRVACRATLHWDELPPSDSEYGD
jgi:hypothetical protein